LVSSGVKLTVADKRWAGQTVIIGAPGPSLPVLAEQCRDFPRIIAVNDAVQLLPNAAICYSCDAQWWEARPGIPGFSGERWTSFSLSPKNIKSPELVAKIALKVIRGEDKPGFSLDSACIRYSSNSGFQAVNLAILFGADPIILIGFDMRHIDGKSHFFGNHKAPLRESTQFGVWCAKFAKAAEMLGPTPRIINATPGSALTCFPYVPLAEALGQRIAA
jgi:hypothetical protein